jgi:hypothetical protein
LNLLLKYSSETTRLSAGLPSGAKHCSSRTQSRSLATEYKIHLLLLCIWQKHTKEVICEGESQGVWRSKCCDLLCRIRTRPSSHCQFRREKEMEFVRQVSLLSEINQQLKQKFGKFAMKRSRLSPRARDTNLFWPPPDRISLFFCQTMKWTENIWVP